MCAHKLYTTTNTTFSSQWDRPREQFNAAPCAPPAIAAEVLEKCGRTPCTRDGNFCPQVCVFAPLEIGRQSERESPCTRKRAGMYRVLGWGANKLITDKLLRAPRLIAQRDCVAGSHLFVCTYAIWTPCHSRLSVPQLIEDPRTIRPRNSTTHSFLEIRGLSRCECIEQTLPVYGTSLFFLLFYLEPGRHEFFVCGWIHITLMVFVVSIKCRK